MAFKAFESLSLFNSFSRAFLLLLTSTSLEAAIIRPLDELKVIEAHISKDSLTRISVRGDRILHVFGVSGEYVLEADEDQGQIFIRPNSFQFSSKPISLTLTTEEGHTQDLRLTPRDQSPEALVLIKPDEEKAQLAKTTPSLAPISREEVESLLQACQEGRIPLGYKLVPVPITQPFLKQGIGNVPLKIKFSQNSIKAHLMREIKGDPLKENPHNGSSLRALTYEIKNTANNPITLSEPEFAKQFEAACRQITSSFPPRYKRNTTNEKTPSHNCHSHLSENPKPWRRSLYLCHHQILLTP